MKKLLFTLFLLSTICSYSQELPENLNGYKYIIIDYKIYPNGNKDINLIGNVIYNELTKYGFTVLLQNSGNYPSDFTENPCQAIICSYDDGFSNSKGMFVTINFKNCKDEIVYTTTEKKFISSNTTEYYNASTIAALKPLKKVEYKYNEKQKVNPDFFKINTSFKQALIRLSFIIN